MSETDGVVVRTAGDLAWVRASGPGHACGACASRGACRSALIGTSLDGEAEPSLLCLPNVIGANAGDAVVIRAREGLLLRAVWLAYGLPLLLALLVAMIVLELTGSEPKAIAGMLLGLSGGFLFLRHVRLDSRHTEPILSMDFKHTFVRGPESC